MKDLIYTQNIVFDMQDFDGVNLKPNTVFKAFTKVATNHAQILGVGFNDMLAKNLLWVVMRVKYQVCGNILPNINYQIKTFPQAKNMLEFDRDFVLQDIKGNILLKGTSKWCVIDSKTRRIARMQNVDVPCAELPPVFEQKFLKTDVFVPEYAPDYSYQVKTDDIDNNGHMTNSVYASIVFDALRLKTKTIKTFQLNFLKEIMLGDRVDVFIKNNGNHCLILGKRCEAENSFSAFVDFFDE